MSSKVQRFSQLILLILAALSLLALVYALWHRRDALADVTGGKDAILYYALPLLGTAAALAFLALCPRLDRLLMLLCVAAILTALMAADVYTGLLFTDEASRAVTASGHLGYPHDARTKAEVIADSRAQGIDAVPFARITSDPNLVTLGVSPNKTVVTCNEFGPWFTPKSDRYGFINPDEQWDQRSAFDAVIVGDSFAMGQCDAVTGGIANVLREKGYRILNLGIGGNDPLLDLASLVEFGSLKKSLMVIWLHYAGNDLAGMATNRNIPILQRYVDDPSFRQGLKDRMPEVARRLAELETAAERPQPTLFDLLTSPKGLARSARLYNLRVAFGFARNTNENVDFALFTRIMRRAQDTADGMGAQLLVVNIPAAGQVANPGVLDRLTRRAIAEAGVPFLDLRTPFLGSSDYRALYSQRYTGHFSPQGNRYVGDLLSELIEAERQ